MTRQPVISVVIPITRYVTELDQALASVLSQSFRDFEIILVDNQATLETRKMAESWVARAPSRIRIVREETRGAVSARNRGILESRGEFVALLDSDDRMKPERLRTQLDEIQNSEEIVLVGSWYDELSPDGSQISKKNATPQIPRWWRILFGESMNGRPDPFYEPQTSTFFFRTEVARKIGMFDPRFDPFWLEDTDFAFRMYQEGRVAIIPQSLVEYRTHPESDSLRRIFDFGLIRKHDLFFSILRDKFYRKEDPKSRRAFSRLQSRWMRETGIKLLAMKNGEPFGRRLVNKALSRDPFDPQTLEAAVRLHLPRRFYPRAFGIRGPVDFSLPSDVDEAFIEALFSL
jgi:glycosyltransferase involved in cell wall biosynthesis